MINKHILRVLKAIVPSDKEIVIANIGTDRELFDSVAPLVGTMLREVDTDYTVYGHMENPITALNVESWGKFIHEKHEDDFIIGVDACISKSKTIGDTYIRLEGVKPGSGVGKTLPRIGDVAILGVIGSNIVEAKLCSLKTVENLASDIVDTLLEFDKIRREEEEEVYED